VKLRANQTRFQVKAAYDGDSYPLTYVRGLDIIYYGHDYMAMPPIHPQAAFGGATGHFKWRINDEIRITNKEHAHAGNARDSNCVGMAPDI